jgi:hypothetical protein
MLTPTPINPLSQSTFNQGASKQSKKGKANDNSAKGYEAILVS